MNSIWSESCKIPERAPLRGDIQAEIAVIGAGMAGLLTASALHQAGRQVVVLDAGRIAGGQTRNTTAKITAQHGLIYQKLIRTLGRDSAKQYAMANEAAIEEYRRLIEAENINCSFEKRNAYVYGDDSEQLQAEAEAAAALGLPASFVRETKLPFPTAGAVCLAHQAQFHPLRFLVHIAWPLTVYENTPVIGVEEDQIETAAGQVRAEHIVFACHYPFINSPACILPGCTRSAPTFWLWRTPRWWTACGSARRKTRSLSAITEICSCWAAADTAAGRTAPMENILRRLAPQNDKF